MSCPFASASSGKRPKLGEVCPVTGKSSDDSEDAIPQGCYISRTGGLDFSICNQLDSGIEIPLANIPHVLSISNLKDLLQASNAVKIPADMLWEDVFFCTPDSLTPLREDKLLSQLNMTAGNLLHMANKNNVTPLFIKATISTFKPIGLYYIPPWTTAKVLKQILTPHTSITLQNYKCFVQGAKLAVEANGKMDASSFVNKTTEEEIAIDDECVHLSTYGTVLDISLRKCDV